MLLISKNELILLIALISLKIKIGKTMSKTACISSLKAHSEVWDNIYQLKKIIKTAFYFDLKSLFVLFHHVQKQLRLISEFISRSGKQLILIHILPNISRSKGNQTIKFCQLTEYNIKDIFPEKIMCKMWWRKYSKTLL